jgi:hypothetical protein
VRWSSETPGYVIGSMGPGPVRVRRWLFPRRLHAKTPAGHQSTCSLVSQCAHTQRAWPRHRIPAPLAPARAAAAPAHRKPHLSNLATVCSPPAPNVPLYKPPPAPLQSSLSATTRERAAIRSGHLPTTVPSSLQPCLPARSLSNAGLVCTTSQATTNALAIPQINAPKCLPRRASTASCPSLFYRRTPRRRHPAVPRLPSRA